MSKTQNSEQEVAATVSNEENLMCFAQLQVAYKGCKESEARWPHHPFKIDHRKNEPLHTLHVRWAIQGILTMDKAIILVSAMARTPYTQMIWRMQEERARLILEDAAHWDAYMQLRDLAENELIGFDGSFFHGNAKIEE